MKTAYLLIALFTFPYALIAQCDSLKEASNSQTGKNQVDALNEYARCFLFTDPNATDSLVKIALEKATHLNYTVGEARAKQMLGLIEVYHNGNEVKGLDYF
jgi:hypothetical protein